MKHVPKTIPGVEVRRRQSRNGDQYAVYRVRYRDAAGNRRSREFDTAEDALDFRAQVRLLRRQGDLRALDAGSERLADFAADWWELYAGRHLSISTLDTYKSIWNVHVNPRLGHLELRQITPLTLEHFAAELADDGVGAATIRKAMSMLQGMLGRAVAWNRLRTNPAPAARKPSAPRQRAIQPLAPAAVERLRQRLLQNPGHGLRDATLISVLAYSGQRPQETLALGWSNVRLNTLLIERKLVRGELVPGQKNKRTIRTVNLLKPLADDLAAYAQQTGSEGLVFPKPNGEPWLDHDFRNWRKRVFRPAAEACGFVALRPYDLRHSYASLLIHEGRPLMEIANQLGHSVETLLRHYAHLIAEMAGQPPIRAEQAILAARTGRAAGARSGAQQAPKRAQRAPRTPPQTA
ncbi:MAG: tyrosine-type recombinase/integrase [Solirubrobacteraceae bacterium]